MSNTFKASGRFDQSFAVHMIRDFFLLLLIVVVAELGARFLHAWWEFEHDELEEIQIVGERLAHDINLLMLNSGGPVAARTIYPILKRGHEKIGHLIAVEPSAATVLSIEDVFDFTPVGIPAAWPDNGKHHTFTVELLAEEFCTTCHLHVEVGETLGQVTVRSYFSTYLEDWWAEVRLTGLVGIGKIFLHTLILFFILRVRMEPLMSLRAAVGSLANAGSDLAIRAKVGSHDEFGELAEDLNQFLDRIGHVIEDLCGVLDRISALNSELTDIQGRVGGRFDNLEAGFDRLNQAAFQANRGDPLLSSEWLNAASVVITALTEQSSVSRGGEKEFMEFLDHLRAVASRAEKIWERYEEFNASAISMSADMRKLSRHLGEMAIIEEKMQDIAVMGQKLADRLMTKNQ